MSGAHNSKKCKKAINVEWRKQKRDWVKSLAARLNLGCFFIEEILKNILLQTMQTSRWQSSQELNLKTLGILSHRRVSKTKWTWPYSQPDRCLCSLLLGTDRYLPGKYSWSTTRNQSEKDFMGALIFMVLTWRPPTRKLLLLWTMYTYVHYLFLA